MDTKNNTNGYMVPQDTSVLQTVLRHVGSGFELIRVDVRHYVNGADAVERRVTITTCYGIGHSGLAVIRTDDFNPGTSGYNVSEVNTGMCVARAAEMTEGLCYLEALALSDIDWSQFTWDKVQSLSGEDRKTYKVKVDEVIARACRAKAAQTLSGTADNDRDSP